MTSSVESCDQSCDHLRIRREQLPVSSILPLLSLHYLDTSLYNSNTSRIIDVLCLSTLCVCVCVCVCVYLIYTRI